MSAWVTGAMLGGGVASGMLLALSGFARRRRTPFVDRVLPYLRDLPQTELIAPQPEPGSQSAVAGVFGPPLRRSASLVERILGGSASVRRRLERANLDISVQDFRIQQVLWGLVGFAATAVPASLVALRSPDRALPLLLCCLVAMGCGVLLRENRLSEQVARRERAMLTEFPSVAELLALAVAAGESPVSALDRVVTRTRGELAVELSRVLGQIRTGTPVARAFDELAARTGLPIMARFAEGLAVAVERGTPLADVLHAQAADVREAGRRALIESGARREVLMMVPVVFLVMPVVVIFAFFPGVIGLNMVVP